MNELEKKVDALAERLATAEQKIENLETEVWYPIPANYAYFISNHGRVKHYANKPVPKITINKSSGYRQIWLGGKTRYIHKLVAEAFIPNPENKQQVDHINGDKLDNRISNLRWATVQENGRNRKRRSDNTTGFKGVTFHKASGKYQAQIKIEGKLKHLGLYTTAEQASEVYEQAAKEIFGEFYRTL